MTPAACISVGDHNCNCKLGSSSEPGASLSNGPDTIRERWIKINRQIWRQNKPAPLKRITSRAKREAGMFTHSVAGGGGDWVLCVRGGAGGGGWGARGSAVEGNWGRCRLTFPLWTSLNRSFFFCRLEIIKALVVVQTRCTCAESFPETHKFRILLMGLVGGRESEFPPINH